MQASVLKSNLNVREIRVKMILRVSVFNCTICHNKPSQNFDGKELSLNLHGTSEGKMRLSTVISFLSCFLLKIEIFLKTYVCIG